MLMHKILQNHPLCAFVANLKIGAINAFYPESFCDKNLAIRKVFAFCDSVLGGQISTSSSRPFFRLIVSYILQSEIKKVYVVPYKQANKMTQAVKNIWMAIKFEV